MVNWEMLIFFAHLKSIHVQCDDIFFNLIRRVEYY